MGALAVATFRVAAAVAVAATATATALAILAGRCCPKGPGPAVVVNDGRAPPLA